MINFINDKYLTCLTILFNGLIFHITWSFYLKYWKIIKNYDILYNLLMGTYIIHYSNYNTIIIYLDFLSVYYIFIMNYLYYHNYCLIHNLEVTYPLSYVLYSY